jgi:hypothetical protein
MSIGEKRAIVVNYCFSESPSKNGCTGCVLSGLEHNWKLPYNKCLQIGYSDEEDLDKAIDLILNSCTDENIIRRISEVKKSKEWDKAHNCYKIGTFLDKKFNMSIKDNVNSPSHYTDGKIEVIEYIEDKKLGFCLGNAIKYISRAGKKYKDKEVEDINKAIWYLKRHIKNIEEAD